MKYKDLENEWSQQWFQFILDHPDKDWVWYWISQHPNITWEIIQSNQEQKWNWFFISQNPNITWEIIQNNPEKNWNWNIYRKIQI